MRAEFGQVVEVLGKLASSTDELIKARQLEWDAKRGAIDALIAEGKLEELDGSPDEHGFSAVFRYHLDKPIKFGASTVDAISFRRGTVGDWRKASKVTHSEDRTALLIRLLSKELKQDSILNDIDASEWDDLSEVVFFPFERAPGGRTRRGDSGGE